MKKIIALFTLIIIFSSCGPTKPWTRWDKACGAFYIAGHGADIASTEAALDNPNNYERNPLLGEHPSDTELAIFMGGTGLLVIYLADRIPQIRKPLLIITGIFGMGAAIHNSQLE